MRLVSNDLGDVLRLALVVHGATRVKRCIRYRGLWYAEI